LQNARLTRRKRHCKLSFVHGHGSPMQPYLYIDALKKRKFKKIL
jgi:hypothetical protein